MEQSPKKPEWQNEPAEYNQPIEQSPSSPEEAKVESATEADATQAVEQARQLALEQPETPLELPVDETPEGAQPQFIDRISRRLRLKQELAQVQTELPRSDRLLSKVIHQPAVKAISEVGSKTVSRPSGLLGGGVAAFLGSLGYFILCKYLGAQYNYLFFVLLFVGGFIIGSLIELSLHSFRRSKA